jgi:hypothetical protein
MINFRKFLVNLLLSVCLAIFSAESAEVAIEENQRLIQVAQQELASVGTVRQTDQGFVYLDVDDNFIYKLFPLIDANGHILKLPPYFNGDRQAGAHVTIMSASEVQKQNIGTLAESGQEIPFSIIAFGSIAPERWKGVERVWFLVIESPALDQLRIKYGLTPKDISYHITVAVLEKI